MQNINIGTYLPIIRPWQLSMGVFRIFRIFVKRCMKLKNCRMITSCLLDAIILHETFFDIYAIYTGVL